MYKEIFISRKHMEPLSLVNSNCFVLQWNRSKWEKWIMRICISYPTKSLFGLAELVMVCISFNCFLNVSYVYLGFIGLPSDFVVCLLCTYYTNMYFLLSYAPSNSSSFTLSSCWVHQCTHIFLVEGAWGWKDGVCSMYHKVMLLCNY